MDSGPINNTNIAWKLIFNEEFERIPDPNVPANLPRIIAKERERKEALERLIAGPGRVLFEQWQKDIKKGLVTLLTTPHEDFCHCSVCTQTRILRIKFELLLDAERIIEGKKLEQGSGD